MKITKTQIIVCELVLIFLVVVAILRNPKPQEQVFESVPDENISTVTVSSIYSSQKRSYSPAKSVEEAKQEKSVTIELGITKKKSGEMVDLDGKISATGKKKKTKKKSEVITIDLE